MGSSSPPPTRAASPAATPASEQGCPSEGGPSFPPRTPRRFQDGLAFHHCKPQHLEQLSRCLRVAGGDGGDQGEPFWVVQETRLEALGIVKASKWAPQRGYRTSFSKANRAGERDLSTSGGRMVGVASHV
eukprot:2566316-Pyramimonas_sp.AAC.1